MAWCAKVLVEMRDSGVDVDACGVVCGVYMAG